MRTCTNGQDKKGHGKNGSFATADGKTFGVAEAVEFAHTAVLKRLNKAWVRRAYPG
jgi:hypothetical protein